MTPIIGLLAEIDDEQDTKLKYSYTKAIENSGGIPLLLPYTESDQTIDRFIEMCNGFVFTGGVDVSPERYGETPQPTCGKVQKYRDELDFKVFSKAMETGKPILAICRGMQLVNAALGGTLYQDIPTEVKKAIIHRPADTEKIAVHDVEVLANTPLSAFTGIGWIEVNTFHHQAIKRLGKGLEVMALADDGIIEAVYLTDHPYLRAYQWHPERLYDNDDNSRRIFDDFIEACYH